MKSHTSKKLAEVQVKSGAVVQGISFEPGLLPKAKVRAKARRRNLSAHICDLVHDDLAKAQIVMEASK